MAALYELSANDLVARMMAREVSPVEVVQAHLARIEALDNRLRAWATVDAERALATARQREQELLAGQEPGRLFGLPLGIKDIFHTAGLRTAANSPLLDQHVPTEDAGAIVNLRRDGAIILGKTVTTQFADGDPSETRNPWNTDRTPGGSSSGSGAAVAARMVPAALGTQTAGSILRPAAFNGVVGLKPSFGRVSRRGVYPFAWSLDTMGCITRDVRDAALVLRSLAGFDSLDAGSVDLPVDHFRAAANEPKVPHLGLIEEYLERAEPEVRAHVLQVAERLDDAGAAVGEVRFPGDLDLALAAHQVIQMTEASDLHAGLHQAEPEAYKPRLRAAIEVGRLLPGAAYVRAQRQRAKLRQAVERLLGRFDALLLPTASHVAPDPSTTGDPSYQAIWTMLGMPSISLPSGVNADGMPLAIQLVGRVWNETGLLSAASWCEAALEPMPAPAL
jgi:aspartyl-tRNA(Asn)/glutamyl-tRNA(Gln) amidotransferase subunit A